MRQLLRWLRGLWNTVVPDPPPPPNTPRDTPTYTDEQRALLKDLVDIINVYSCANDYQATSETRQRASKDGVEIVDRIYEDDKVRIHAVQHRWNLGDSLFCSVLVRCVNQKVLDLHMRRYYRYSLDADAIEELSTYRPGLWISYVQKLAKRARQRHERADRRREAALQLARQLAFEPVDDAECFSRRK